MDEVCSGGGCLGGEGRRATQEACQALKIAKDGPPAKLHPRPTLWSRLLKGLQSGWRGAAGGDSVVSWGLPCTTFLSS